MYKPPENCNRVRAITSKFENNTTHEVKTENTKTAIPLGRQLSDPVKIKRSPAFRNDKLLQRNNAQASLRGKVNDRLKNDCDPVAINKHVLVRNDFVTKSVALQRKSVPLQNPVTQSIATKLNVCTTTNPIKSPVSKTNSVPIQQNSFSSLRKRFDSQENLNEHFKLKTRSNTSAEIILNKKSFDSNENLNQQEKAMNNKILNLPKLNNNEIRYENIGLLYTEPIPKSLRNKENNIHNANTIKISDKLGQLDNTINYKLNALTDTLKLALKKPLPAGPAPQKPPRTFVHNTKTETNPLKLNKHFTKELNRNLQKSLEKPKGDPKYMLDKLENALKNNKIRLKKQHKIDVTDEELAEQNKPKTNTFSTSKYNLNNCLPSFNCAASSGSMYEPLSTTKTSSFVNCNGEEPVYAEPFVFNTDNHNTLDKHNSLNNANHTLEDKKQNRTSLYYMSSPVLGSVVPETNSQIFENTDDMMASRSEPSSPSTSSDIESATSEENKRFTSPKIKDLIKSFEHKKSDTLPANMDSVDKLEKQLRLTINKSFKSSETAHEHSNGNTSERSSIDEHERAHMDEMVGKYETYVKTIRMFSKSRRKSIGKHLFHSCLLVGLNGKTPYIKFKFPPNAEVPVKIEVLCYPDSAGTSIDYSTKAQNYSLVITNDKGDRVYGYCRRVLPENSLTCLPLAYCILSEQRAPRFYKRILEEIESRHGIPDKLRDILLNEFYYHRFPMPGESVRINLAEINKFISDTTLQDDRNGFTNKENCTNGVALNRLSKDLDLNTFVVVSARGKYGTLSRKKSGISDDELASFQTPTELILTLHQDSRFKETDLEELCTSLNINILQKVFASLLLERKVIFISCLLGKLSTCIEAIQNILYPFSWPHTLIPVVPKELWEIVEAPTPVICGALSLAVVNDFNIEDAIVVDLDEGAILGEVGDECKILPTSLIKEFKEGMLLANSSGKENESAYNVLLSDAFIRIFINSCGHYKQYIKNGVFQKEEFLIYPKSKSVRRFLKWFTETTMFCTFIDTVLADANSFRIFDKRIQIYSSHDATLILEKMKDWKKEKSNTLFF